MPLVHRPARVLCAALFILALVPHPEASAQGSVAVTVSDSTRIAVVRGRSVRIPLLATPSGTNIASFTGGLSWGTTRFKFDSVTTGPFGTLTANTTNAASGSAIVGAFRVSGQTARDTIANLWFTADTTSASPVTQALVGGTRLVINPTAAGNETGTNILANVIARSLDLCVVSGAFGDANADKNVNIIDAQQVARKAVGLPVANDTAVAQRGDVTGDGAVNIIDAQQIARFAVGLSAAARVNTAAYVAPAVGSVVLAPSAAQIVNVGEAIQVTADPRNASNASVLGCASVTWSSSDPTKATVSPDGRVVGVAPGSVTITATSGGATATLNVTVAGPTGTVAASLQIVQGSNQFARNGTIYGVRPQVRVLDAASLPVPGVGVTFTVSGGSVRAPGSNVSLQSVTVMTDALGIAQPGDWISGSPAGAGNGITAWSGTGTLTASVTAVAPVTFTGTALQGEVGGSNCALTNAGATYCVGEYEQTNLNGRLVNDPESGKLPVAVPGGVALASLSPNFWGEFTCGLAASGAAHCFGWNHAGQLGDGTTTPSAGFRAVTGGLTFTKIASGHLHTCAITPAGAAYCWGLGQAGQLGNGTLGQMSTAPVAVGGGHLFSDIATGTEASCGVKSNGQVWCWGRAPFIDSAQTVNATPRQLPSALTFTKIAVNSGVLCGVTTVGGVSCTGPASASLGIGNTTTNHYGAFTATNMPTNAKDIYGNSNFFCAVGVDNTIYCWGTNSLGQLGVGDQLIRSSPTLVGPYNPKRMMLQPFGVCFQVQNNHPYCHGSFAIGDGIIGLESPPLRTTPVPMKWVEGTAGAAAAVAINTGAGQSAVQGTALAVPPSVKVTDFNGAPVSGVNVTFAAASGGGAVTGGSATTDASGIATVGSWTMGATAGVNTLSATVTGLPQITISAYGTLVPASIAISSGDAQVMTSGSSYPGQLVVLVKDASNTPVANAPVTFAVTAGGGSISAATTVVLTDSTGLARATAFAPSTAVPQTITATVGALTPVTFNLRSAGTVSGDARCELTSAGAAFCWGQNSRGQVGDGTTVNKLIPTAVGGGIVFASLAVGSGDHACGLTAAGVAHCWGANAFGQIGDGTTTDRTAPTLVGGGLVFTKLILNQYSTCGLTAAGTLHCWGWAGQGIYGDGALGIVRTAPTAVTAPGLTFTDAALGQFHICGIAAAGAAYCWGAGSSGQIGDGLTGLPRTSPSAVQGGIAFTSLALGSLHSCGLTAAGVAHCWGAGQLGTGSANGAAIPVQVAGGLTFASISAGTNTTCARTTTGIPYCWGVNTSGQVGDGTTAARQSPTAVFGGLTLGAISVRANAACGRASAGNQQPFCWGGNSSGQVGDNSTTTRTTPVPVKWVEGTAGVPVSVVINSASSQAAVAGTSVPLPPSVLVRDFANTAVAGVSIPFTIASGGGSVTGSPAITNASGIATISSWTLGATVGTNTLTVSAAGLPAPVFTAQGTVAPAALTIDAGDNQATPNNSTYLSQLSVLVKDASNTAMANAGVTFAVASGGGSISGSPLVYTDASGFARVTVVAPSAAGVQTVTATVTGLAPVTFNLRSGGTVNGDTRCELNSAGAAFCWGINNRGQIGDGTTTNRNVPTAVGGGIVFASLADGNAEHACGLTAAGVAYCWGANSWGQIGDNTFIDRTAPTPVSGGLTFTKLALSPAATCGRTTAGAMYCWGWAGAGLYVDGAVGIVRTTPTQVNLGGASVADFAMGFLHQCGVSTEGALYCWGNNSSGQVGDGTVTARGVPTLVSGGLTFASVTLGSNHTCALTTTGAAYCWGFNNSGPLGTGNTTSATVPTAVVGGLTFASISAGSLHTCARTAAGAAYCWGINTTGQIGDGTTTLRTSPTAVAGGMALGKISARYNATCGRLSSGNQQPFCWGANGAGQLGDNSIAQRNTPVPVKWVDGTPGAAVSLTMHLGDGQTAAVNTAVPAPPSVIVRDYAGNPVSGIAVTFAVASGGGSITGGSATTNASGIATVGSWTLGPSLGANTITATSSGLGQWTFTATAVAASGATLTHSYPFTTNANDVVGTAHGTLVGGATVGGGVLVLDGTTGYVQLVGKIVPAQGSYSVSLWARHTVAQTAFAEFISQGQSGGPGFYIGHDPSRFMRAGDAWIATGAAAAAADGAFHHYALVVDSSANRSYLYVDGLLRSTLQNRLAQGAAGTDTRFGRQFGAGAGEFLNGALDEVRTYIGALTSSEIFAIFTAGQTGTVPVAPTSLITAVNVTGSGLPANLAAVAGSINVSVGVDPGTSVLDSVVVRIGGVNAGKQTFTAGVRATGLQASAVTTLVFTINSATFANGATTLQAVVYGKQGGSPVSATASMNITLSNAPPLAATVNTPSFTFSPASATIGAGGTVTWNLASTHTVVFDTGGSPSNIPTPVASDARVFSSVGSFNYHCSVHPSMTGTVVVQ